MGYHEKTGIGLPKGAWMPTTPVMGHGFKEPEKAAIDLGRINMAQLGTNSFMKTQVLRPKLLKLSYVV